MEALGKNVNLLIWVRLICYNEGNIFRIKFIYRILRNDFLYLPILILSENLS